jgi:hypothetical protein
MQQYPTLKLADIYFSIWYYLQHRAELDTYLREREEKGEEARKQYATPVDLQMLRDRLAAREVRQAKGDT